MLRIFVCCLILLLFIGSSHKVQTKPSAVKTSACGDTPELNKKILEYVKSNIGKKVGRGECWDVVAGALNSSGAKWDKKFGFGKEVNYQKACVFPGDIIQLKDALVEYKSEKGLKVYDEYPQHSAIVIEVKNKQEYIIADQNFGFGDKKLSSHPLDLKKMVRGSVKVYRPVK